MEQPATTPMRIQHGNVYALAAAIALVIEQLIVAMSTLLIGEIGAKAARSDDLAAELAIFCLLLVVVYVPSAIARTLLVHAEYHCYQDFLSRVDKRLWCRPDLWADTDERSGIEPFYEHDAWLTIRENYAFGFEAAQTMLNVVLTSLAVVGLLGSHYLVAYGLAFLVTMAGSFLARRWLDEPARAAAQARNELFDVASRGPRQILVGNLPAYRRWNVEFCRRTNHACDTEARFVARREANSFLLLAASIVPVLAALLMDVTALQGNFAGLATLAVLLPRQVLIVQGLGQLSSLLMQLTERRARTARLLEALTPSTAAGEGARRLTDRIEWVEIKGVPRSSAELSSPGRLAIRGANGSGKSSLLALLKLRLGECALLILAEPSVYDSDDGCRGSTGERASSALRSAVRWAREGPSRVLLLDEWDANLDITHRQELDEELDRLATTNRIVEVRHASPNASGGNVNADVDFVR